MVRPISLWSRTKSRRSEKKMGSRRYSSVPHSAGVSECAGGVLNFMGTDGVMIENCSLYGCGVLGVSAANCSNMDIRFTEIHHCSFGAFSFNGCRSVNIESCNIHDIPGNFYQIYDCRKVTAPCPELTEEQVRSFEEIGRKLAEHLHLRGIMDVEVIDDGGKLKVLEIDARLPSQTPLAICFAAGVNFLSELAAVTLTGEFPEAQPWSTRHAAYEHYRITEGELVQEGEHMMSDALPLTLHEGFPWTKVMVSDEMPGLGDFRGIFINSEETAEELERVRARLYGALERRLARNG